MSKLEVLNCIELGARPLAMYFQRRPPIPPAPSAATPSRLGAECGLDSHHWPSHHSKPTTPSDSSSSQPPRWRCQWLSLTAGITVSSRCDYPELTELTPLQDPLSLCNTVIVESMEAARGGGGGGGQPAASAGSSAHTLCGTGYRRSLARSHEACGGTQDDGSQPTPSPSAALAGLDMDFSPGGGSLRVIEITKSENGFGFFLSPSARCESYQTSDGE